MEWISSVELTERNKIQRWAIFIMVHWWCWLLNYLQTLMEAPYKLWWEVWNRLANKFLCIEKCHTLMQDFYMNVYWWPFILEIWSFPHINDFIIFAHITVEDSVLLKSMLPMTEPVIRISLLSKFVYLSRSVLHSKYIERVCSRNKYDLNSNWM